MATTVDISTADELWKLLTGETSSSYDDTWNITADLDFSDLTKYEITGTLTLRNITGNDHYINGLTSYITGSSYTTILGTSIGSNRNYTTTISNVRFSNIQATNCTLFSTYYNLETLKLSNCVITGDLGRISSGDTKLYRSGVYIAKHGATIEKTAFEQCWVHIEWLSQTAELSQIISAGATNTYFEGTIPSTYTISLSLLGPGENCVVNFETSAAIPKMFYSISNSASICLFNSTKMSDVTSMDYCIGLSDSALKSVDSVAETGFPIS